MTSDLNTTGSPPRSTGDGVRTRVRDVVPAVAAHVAAAVTARR